MARLNDAVRFALIGVLAVGSIASGTDELSIAFKQAENEPELAINLEEPIAIQLTNESQHEIRTWDLMSNVGYNAIALRIVDPESGVERLTTRKKITDAKFFEAARHTLIEGTQTLTIKPGESVEFELQLLGFAWGERAWENLPDPTTGKQQLVQIIMDIPDTNRGEPNTWSGRITSAQVPVRFTTETIKTPHQFLWNEMPETALRLLKANPEWTNKRDRDWRTPLHLASRFDFLEVIEWLCENGADINSEANNELTPLHFASTPETVALLLKYKPELEANEGSGRESVLQSKAESFVIARTPTQKMRWKTICDLLVEAGAKVDPISAIRLGDLDRLKEIVESGKLPRGNFRSPLRVAVQSGNLAVAKYLVDECDADVDQFEEGFGYPVLLSALPHPEIVKLLIDRGADLNREITWKGGRSGEWIIRDNATLLHYAMRDGEPQSVTLLIDSGIDVFAVTEGHFFEDDFEDQTALDVAAEFGEVDNARALLEHPEFENTDKQQRQEMLDRCLCVAASSYRVQGESRFQLVELLLDAGASPNAEFSPGVQVSQLAAFRMRSRNPDLDNHNLKTLRLLQTRGADIELFSAIALGDVSNIETLISQKPEQVGAVNHENYPALHFAVRLNQTDAVQTLLNADADVNLRNRSDFVGSVGETPLHVATMENRLAMAELLIKFGADVNAKDENGRTPLEYATRLKSEAITKLLLQNGAKTTTEF